MLATSRQTHVQGPRRGKVVHHGHASRTTVGLWASADAGALNRSNARAGELGHARRFFSLPLKVSEAVQLYSFNLYRWVNNGTKCELPRYFQFFILTTIFNPLLWCVLSV